MCDVMDGMDGMRKKYLVPEIHLLTKMLDVPRQ